MEQPEAKAKMEETRKEQQQLRDREYAMVYKAMDRRQVSVFKKMLGKPFDVESVMGGGFSAAVVREGGGTGPMATPTRPRLRPKPIPPRRHPQPTPIPVQPQPPSRPRLPDGKVCVSGEALVASSPRPRANRLTDFSHIL